MPVNIKVKKRITLIILLSLPVIVLASKLAIDSMYSEYILLHSLLYQNHITDQQAQTIENAAIDKFNISQRLTAINVLNKNERYQNVDNILTAILNDTNTSPADKIPLKKIRLMYCRNAFQMNNIPEAIARFSDYTSRYTQDKTAKIEFAGLLYQSGSKHKAIDIYTSLIAQHPDDIDLYTTLADIAMSDSDTSEKYQNYLLLAQNTLEQAIAAEPSVELYKKLAFILTIQKKYYQAAQILHKCTPFGINDPELCIALAMEIQHAKNIDDHLTTLFNDITEQIIASHSASSTLLLPYARGNIALNQTDKALSLYLKYLNLSPNDLSARFDYANLLHNQKLYAQAEQQYQLILADFPPAAPDTFTKDTILLQAARNAVRMHNIELAHQRYTQYLTIKPTDAQVIIEAASILKQNNRLQQAQSICQAHLKYILDKYDTTPSDTNLPLQIGRMYIFIDDFNNALKWYDLYCSSNPNDTKARLEQARLAGWNLQYTKAIKFYQAMYDYFDDHIYKLEQQAKQNNWLRRNSLAVKYYNELIADKPDDVELLYDLAQLYNRLGIHNKAESIYQQIADTHPWHIQAEKALQAQSYKKKQSLAFDTKYGQSKGRNDDVDLRSFSNQLTYSPARELTDRKWQFAIATESISLTDTDTTRNSAAISMSQLFEEYLNLSASIRLNNYSNNEFNSFEIVSALSKNFDFFDAALTAGKLDFFTNSKTYFDKTSRTYIGANINTRPFYYTSLDFRAKHYWHSDNNQSDEFGFTGEYEILKYPTLLKAIIDLYSTQTRDEDDKYWSPSNYYNRSIGLGWYHYLDKENYEGSTNFYYYLEGYIGIDSDSEQSTTTKIGLVYETQKKFDIGIEYFLSNSDVYDSSYLTTHILIRW